MAPPRRAVTLPCVRCGREGGPTGTGRHLTPQRLDGRRFGYDGAVCGACYGVLNKRGRAQIKADLAGLPHQPRAWELAEAILKFRDALAGASVKAQAAALADMVRLAESV